MRALLVVDVQTDVMKGRNTEGLIEACNDIIGRYAPKNVVYIVNKLPWESSAKEKELGAGLNVVSNLLFDKKRSNAFSNPGLLRALRDMGADEVEIIGIDGNGSAARLADPGPVPERGALWPDLFRGRRDHGVHLRGPASALRAQIRGAPCLDLRH